MAITVDPMPQWPIELRNTRGLHGAITSVLDEPHGRFAQWALFPTPEEWRAIVPSSQWSVFWFGEKGAALASSTVNSTVFDRPSAITFGPLVRFRAPQVKHRGHQRVQIDTITPVMIRTDGGAKPCVCPSASNIASAIGSEFVTRIAPSEAWAKWVRERVRVNLIERRTEATHIPFGGKYGTMHGWSGTLVLEVNAVARWLLGVAERTGLGGRTSMGCGRIRVREVA